MARNGRKAKQLADQAVVLADYAAKALVAADKLQIKNKPIEQLPLEEDQRPPPGSTARSGRRSRGRPARGTANRTALSRHILARTAR
jgi:hypothetical protein